MLLEMEYIIQAALEVPEDECEAFFSAIGGLKETTSGIIKIPKQKGKQKLTHITKSLPCCPLETLRGTPNCVC